MCGRYPRELVNKNGTLCCPPHKPRPFLFTQPVRPVGPAADHAALRPPQGLPADRLGRVGALLQNLPGPGVPRGRPHPQQTSGPVPRGRGGGVRGAGGL